MFARDPPIAIGYRVSRQITTLEDFYGPAERTNKNKSEYRKSKKNNGGTTRVATNLRSYLNPIIPECNPEGSGNNNSHRGHRNTWISANDCHACHGSCWLDLKLPAGLGPSLNNSIPTLRNSIGVLDHLQVN